MEYRDTGIKNVQARISKSKPSPEGKITVYGIGIVAKTTKPYNYAKRHQRTINSNAGYEAAVQYLIDDIAREYRAPNIQAKRIEMHTSGFFYTKFSELSFTEKDALCYGDRGKWAETTTIKAISYFVRNVLPRMDELGEELISADLADIVRQLTLSALKSGNSYKDYDTAYRGVLNRFGESMTIYSNWLEAYPELGLPIIEYAAKYNTINYQPEQCKSLPDKVRANFTAALLDNAHRGCMLGAGIMYCGGARTAEAASPNIGDIILCGNYATLSILEQNRDGENVSVLKTKSAYRVIVLPRLMVSLIEARIEHLQGRGYTAGEIAVMPCVAKDSNPTQRAATEELSVFARKLLENSGCTTQYIASALREKNREPVDVDGAGSKRNDVVAYVLRHDWCSRACNTCGLPMNTVDYLLGHSNPHTKSKDNLTPEVQREIAKKLERHVASPEHSLHPACTPHRLTHGGHETVVGYTEQLFVATKDVEITLSMSCMEPDDGITIALPHHSVLNIHVSSQKDTPEKRSVRQLIGKASIQTEEYYAV